MGSSLRNRFRYLRIGRWTLLGGMSLLLFFSAAIPLHADDRVNEGALVFKNSCQICHGVSGKNGPFSIDLVGQEFVSTFHTNADLFNFVSKNMPRSNPGSLSNEDYLNVVSYIQNLNGITVSDDQLLASATPRQSVITKATPNLTSTVTPSSMFTFQATVTPNVTTPVFIVTTTPSPHVITDIIEPVHTPSDIDGLVQSDAIRKSITNGWIPVLSEKGKTLFQPSQPITRGQFIAAVIAANGIIPPVLAKSLAYDIASNPARDAINYAISKKWIVPTKSQTILPKQPITRADAAVFAQKVWKLKSIISKTLKDVPKTDPRAGAVGALVKQGGLRISSNRAKPLDSLSRADAAWMLSKLVK